MSVDLDTGSGAGDLLGDTRRAGRTGSGPAPLRVLVLAAAGPRHGLGHAMRCSVLAGAMVEAGVDVDLLLAGGDRDAVALVSPIDAVAAEDPGAESWPGFLEGRLSGGGYGWVVQDGYGFLRQPFAAICKRHGTRLLVIDDVGDTPIVADMVLNPNGFDDRPYRRPPMRVDRLLMGPRRYALVDESYRETRWVERGALGRLLISFGGSDTGGFSRRALRGLESWPTPLDVEVVVGPYACADGLADALTGGHRVRLHRGLTTLAGLLGSVDAAVVSASVTAWQAAVVGTPMIAIRTADNQDEVVQTLAEHGAALTLDWTGRNRGGEDALVTRLAELARPETRQRLSAAARALIDGRGAERVVAALRQGTTTGD